ADRLREPADVALRQVLLQQRCQRSAKLLLRFCIIPRIILHEVRVSRYELKRVTAGMLDEDCRDLLERLLHDLATMLFHNTQLWPKLRKREPASHSNVNNGQTAICAVHRAQHVQVRWQFQALGERLTEVIRQANFTRWIR